MPEPIPATLTRLRREEATASQIRDRVAQSRDQHQRRQSVNYARGEDMGLRGRQLDLTSPPRIMNEPTGRQRAAMEADGVDPASFGRW